MVEAHALETKSGSPSEHYRVLDRFHQRILASVSRSPLLRATVTRTGRLLDCSRFETVDDGLSKRILRSVVEGRDAEPVDLRLQLRHAEGDDYGVNEESEESRDDRLAREHRGMYDALDRRMRRFAELVKRETGVHSLWLGYPLLYVDVGEPDTQQQILAPVFLWPISIRRMHEREGRIVIERHPSAGPVRFNRAMAEWVDRQLNFKLRGPTQDSLERLSWTDLNAQLISLASQFHDMPNITCDAPLEPAPNLKLLSPQQSPCFFNSAVLGVYRWQNEAILADLEELKNRDRLSGVASGFTSGETLPRPPQAERPPEADRYQVCDADFSQERAIWHARKQPGLVIHGPPGTGKSQTIVNIIADALAHGRTVLMVCQKYAATRVVFEKLKQVGLENLCVEATDSERSRLPIFREIRDQVDLLPTHAPNEEAGERNRIARDITRLEDELDQYARAMHEHDSEVGLAYRRMKTIEGETYAKFPSVRPLRSIHSVVGGMSFEQVESLTEAIKLAGRQFASGRPLTNPWRFRQETLQMTAALQSDIGAVVTRLRELDSGHVNQVVRYGAGVEISGTGSEFGEVVSRVVPILRELHDKFNSQPVQILRAWVRRLRTMPPDVWEAHRIQCQNAQKIAKQVVATPLDARWDEYCGALSEAQQTSLFQDARVVVNYKTRWWRFLSLEFRRAHRAIRETGARAGTAGVLETAQEIKHCDEACGVRKTLASMNRKLLPNLGPRAGGEQAQVEFSAVVLDQLNQAQGLCRLAQEHCWLRKCLDEFVADNGPAMIEEILSNIEKSSRRKVVVKQLIDALHNFESWLQHDVVAEPERLIRAGKSIADWLDAVESGLDRLESLMAWSLRRPRFSEPLKSIIKALEEYELQRLKGGHVPSPPPDLPEEDYGQWWLALVRYAASLSWQCKCRQRYPILAEMTPEIHANKVRELDRLVREKRNLEAETIQARWSRDQFPHRDAPWKRMFQLRRSKHGEAKRLREAVKLSLPEGLLKMRPCWLVNPGVAAELFPLQEGLFDLVIFDEASQCPIEQAIPVIYRGKAVVVSGDEKQLPPTRFFASSSTCDETEGEDGDDDATEQIVSREHYHQKLGVEYLLQVEDLLSAAIGTLPERLLSVHYRSKHPDLIEFSNRAFYNGRLEAPPAQGGSENGDRPIRYIEVDGLYDQRTNEEEGRRVVKLLREMWCSVETAGPTVGVVTFNRPQRDLIEDILEKESSRDQAFAVRFEQEKARQEENQDVGFFVKNLENVQGDERDVMIFSTTFGRDGTGRFFRRFGPVGEVGGERRLNVAVTRAKNQVIVVGSMPIAEISTALSVELGPGSQLTPAGYLQLYLAYAKAVSEGDRERLEQILKLVGQKSPAMVTGDPDSPFEADVRNVLEKLGFEVRSQVGDSGFRIDLGVVAADPAFGYLLGIECDGASYHSDRSARLRDVWREEILRKRGWRLHRIWSTRWWDQRSKEIDVLKIALDDAQARLEKKLSVESTTEASEPHPSIGANDREAWEMSLAEWKQRCNELRERRDVEGLRAIGGRTTDSAHRYRVEQALKEGKPVPVNVLNDYPELFPENVAQSPYSDENDVLHLQRVPVS